MIQLPHTQLDPRQTLSLEQAIQTTAAGETGEETGTDARPTAAPPLLDVHGLLLRWVVAALGRTVLRLPWSWVVSAVGIVVLLLVRVAVHHLSLGRR